MEDKLVLQKNPGMVSRVIGGETVLLPIYRKSEDINCIYTFNKTASWIWDRIDGKRSVGDIRRQVRREFDGEADEVGAKMDRFLKELTDIEAVI